MQKLSNLTLYAMVSTMNCLLILLALQLPGIYSQNTGFFFCNSSEDHSRRICQVKDYTKKFNWLKFVDSIEMRDNTENLIIYNVKGMNTENLLQQIFIQYKYVEKLLLSKSDNLIISETSFENAFELKELNIRSNNIHAFSGNIFKNMKKLNRIDASENDLQRLDAHVFQGINNLTSIDLSYNNLKHIATGTFNHLNLQTLFLNHNQLAEFNFQKLNVQYIQLQKNELNEIIVSNDTPLDLKEIILEFNNLTAPNLSVLKHFKNIEIVIATNNLIDQISSDTFQGLTHLNTIYLSYNRIRTIEKGAFHNLSLLFLFLNNNQLIEFDFQYMTVERLDITKNELSSILVNGNISKLHLDNNKIIKIYLETRTLVDLTFENNDESLRIQFV